MCKVTISVFEFMKLFPDEHKAREWVEHKRWNGNPTCTYCSTDKAYKTARVGTYRCRQCDKDFTVRMKTVMHRSHIPMHKWLYAMYCVVTARKGISSLQLSKELGMTQKSAWFLLQRIRAACHAGDQLLGKVLERDEIDIGRKDAKQQTPKKLTAGRGAVGKQAVRGMRHQNGKVKATTRERLDAMVNGMSGKHLTL